MFFLLLQNVSFLNALSRPLFAYFIINDKRWKTLPTAGSELWFLCCWKYHINCQTSNVLWLNVTFKGYWTADLRYYKWLFYHWVEVASSPGLSVFSKSKYVPLELCKIYGAVVGVLAFYSDDPSSNHVKVYNCMTRTKITHLKKYFNKLLT